MYYFGNNTGMNISEPQFDAGPAASHPSRTGLPENLASGSVLLLADDLTGACDACLGFVNQGFTASVLLQNELPEVVVASDVVAVVTHTRNLPPQPAAECIQDLQRMHNFNAANIFHKVDSAGRGNPGAEMEAIAGRASCDAIVFAPAFPGAGRVVRQGQLHVTDFSGQDTEISLASLVPASIRTQVEILPAAPAHSLRSGLSDAYSAGRNLWICDAVTPQDLNNLVEAAAGLGLRLLWSGSAGLAAAVAQHLAAGCSGRAVQPVLPVRPGRTLVVCGTDHPVTLAQMQQLAASAVEVSMDAAVVPEFACGFLQMDWSRVTEDALRGFWHRLHNADQPPITSLLLTGGDTAAFVLEALHAVALKIGGQVEQGIPWSLVQGGLADGVLVITKSGGFGTPESLRRSAEFSQRIRA
jgi:uncharacterized protein YgbK (DUF1537 family)